MRTHRLAAIVASATAGGQSAGPRGEVLATLPEPIVEICRARETLLFTTASGDNNIVYALPVTRGEIRTIATLPRG